MEAGSREGPPPSPQVKYRTGQATGEKPKRSFFSKARNVLLGLGITAGAGVAVEATAHPAGNAVTAVVRGAEDILQTKDEVVDVNSGLYGRFLHRQEDGTLVLSETPEVVQVKYEAHADPTSRYWNENNIVVHRDPKADYSEGQDINPAEIKATHAVRTTGGAYDSSGIGRFEIEINGTKYTVGEWFRISDEQGNPVDLNGDPLKPGEKPYSVAGSFTTVQSPSTSSQAPSQ